MTVMVGSQNFLTSPLLSIGGAELTGAETLLIAGAIVLAYVVLRRMHLDAERGERERDRAVQDGAVADTVARLAESHQAINERLATLLEASAAGQSALRKSMDDRLDAVARRLGEGLTQTQTRTSESLSKLNERLALIDRAQKNIETLSTEVSGLQALLANKQRRGAFGEMQMGDLVANFLPPNAFELQAALSTGVRVDCLIKLPAPPGDVAVDAKFPMENWRAFAEAQESDARDAAARAFRADVLRHVKAIAEKYLIPGETAETALMFLPSEAVYATLHAEFADVVDKSFRARVMIVSPTTFMATLHTMRAVMRDARLREQAHVIQREVALLSDDVARLDDRVGKLQRHFGQAEDDMRQIRISAEKVGKRAERIADVDVEEGAAGKDALPKTERPQVAAE